MVLLTWIFFFWSTTFLEPEKRWIYSIKPPFSGQPLFLNQISWTRFLKPLFYTFLEKGLQNKWSTGHSCGYFPDQNGVNALVETFFSLKGENEFIKESFFYFTKVKIMFRNIFFENNEISCTIFWVWSWMLVNFEKVFWDRWFPPKNKQKYVAY